MIIVMKPNATEENLARVKEKIERAGLSYHLSVGETRTIVGVIGDKKIIGSIEENMSVLDGVEKAVRITEKYKLVSRRSSTWPGSRSAARSWRSWRGPARWRAWSSFARRRPR